MSYPGGKNRVYQHLINLIPYHTAYFAPFLGEDAIMQHKRPAIMNVGLDIDPAVITRWQKGTIKPAPGTPPAPHYMILAHDHTRPTLPLPLGEGRGEGSPSDTTTSNGAAPQTPSVFSSSVATQLKVSVPTTRFGTASAPPIPVLPPGTDPARYRTRWAFINADYKYLLCNWPFTHRHFVYIDAPYLQDVRASQRPLYNHEFNTEEQHCELLQIALKLPCLVMISHYHHPLYADMLSTWHTASYTTHTRSGRKVREYLWMNYDRPTHLHDYSYLGNNYRQRETIKKKQDRWVENWSELPPLERRAILRRLAEQELLA